MAGWDSALGFQSWSGSSLNNGGVNAAGANLAVMNVSKAWAIDGQMQGALGEMPTGFYFSYAKANASDPAAAPNAFNTGNMSRSSFNVDAEIGIIPEVATIGAAIRRGKAGVADVGGSTNATDNAYYLTATYKVAQNMLARLSYVNQSGTFWDLPSGVGTLTNAQNAGSTVTALNLYVLF